MRGRLPSRALVAWIVLTAVAVAQDGAFYDVPALPGVFDVPLPSPPSDSSDGSVAEPLVGGADFGALTASPTPELRDVNGDGHLDVLRAFGGVAVWLGRGDGRFDPPIVSASLLTAFPFQYRDGLWADVDGDGRLDVVFVNQTEVEVLLDQGDGSFVAQPVQATDVIWDNTARTAGDYDGDGFADLIGTGSQGGALRLAKGRGDGTFVDSEQLVASPGFKDGVALGHLDDDGRVDVVTMFANGSTNGELLAFRQNANGKLVLSDTVPGLAVSVFLYASDLAIRDMDGDGNTDVLASTPGVTTSIAVAGFFRGDGLGGLDPVPVTIPVVGANPVYVDVDGDGRIDVASRGIQPPGALLVSLARADGTLAPPVATRHRGEVRAFGDVDGDGRVDALGDTAVWFGRGDGAFDAPRVGALGVDVREPRHVVVDDVDGDGRLDVVAVGSKFVNDQGTAIVRGRFGGGFDAPDLLLVDEPTDAVAVADLDGDGIGDIASTRAFGTEVYLFEGRADGSFVAPEILDVATFGGHSGLALAQIGGGPLPDLVLASDALLVVRQNLGDFVFGPRIDTPLPAPVTDPWVLAHDVDGDGRDDVFVATPFVYLYRAEGSSPFAAPVALGGAASSMRLVDVDGDGDRDLLTTHLGDVVAYHALGGGDFGPAVTLVSLDADATAADAADVDGDGLIDLAVGQFERVALFLGVAPGVFAPTPVDVYDRPGGALLVRFVDEDDDGRPDLLTVGRTGAVAPSLSPHRDGTWRDLGFGLPGAGLPRLFAKGDLSPGSTLVLELADAPPGAATTLVAGLDAAFAPFKGGVLVPQPTLIVPGLPVSSEGEVRLVAGWPPGIPVGTRLLLQAWAPDVDGPAGWTASGAVEGRAG